MLGTWTWGGRMVGADESTELWRHPIYDPVLYLTISKSSLGKVNDQCDQIGRFFIVLDNNFFTKEAQIFVDFLWYFEKHYLLNKNISAYILGNFWRKFGCFLDKHLGHTDQQLPQYNIKRNDLLLPTCCIRFLSTWDASGRTRRWSSTCRWSGTSPAGKRWSGEWWRLSCTRRVFSPDWSSSTLGSSSRTSWPECSDSFRQPRRLKGKRYTLYL